MAWPFTPITTFIAKSVPKVTAAFLNSLQAVHNAVFAPVLYRRASIYAESTDGTNVTLRIAALTVLDETTNEYVFAQQASHVVSTTWPTSAWRYLYLVSTSGVSSIEISSTAPVTPIAGPLYKNGDVTRRYLCAVRCDPGGSVVKFTMIDGRYLYFDTNLLLTDTGTASWETLDMSLFVPPHARRANLRVRVTNGAGSPDGPTFRSFSVGGIQLQAGATSFAERDLFIATAGDTVEWNAAVTTDIVVLARGWEE